MRQLKGLCHCGSFSGIGNPFINGVEMHVSEEKHERLSSSNADIRQLNYHLSSLEARNGTYASLPSFSTVVYQNPMTSHRDRDAFMRSVQNVSGGGGPPGPV